MSDSRAERSIGVIEVRGLAGIGQPGRGSFWLILASVNVAVWALLAWLVVQVAG
jgi:hypothetical protein